MSGFFFSLTMLFIGGVVISFIAIIRPFERFIQNRKKAFFIHLGCWLGMFVAAAVGSSFDPEFKAKMAAQKQADAAADARKEQETKRAAAESEAQARGRLLIDAKATWASILSTLKPCDDASKQVADGFSRSSNPYALYPIVSSAKEVCSRVGLELGQVAPPASATGEAKGQFEKAIKACRDGYSMKAVALGSVLDVINGENRPSDVQDALEQMKTASQAPIYCVASYVDAMTKSGISNEDAIKLLGKP